MATNPPESVFLRERQNKLAKYASYTYGLSLHLLKPKDYNQLMLANPRVYSPKNVLISSAGKHGADFERNIRFQEDFFIDNLSMTSIPSTEKGSAAVNKIEFTVIEPYGMTFFNRILAILDDDPELKNKNWTKLPFMLQIDFYGYDDDGFQVNTEIKKYIPIMISTIKTRITSQGAEYNFEAIPYAHEALNLGKGITPTNMDITASTVGDYLLKYKNNLNSWQRTLRDKQKSNIVNTYDFDIPEAIKNSTIKNINPRYSSMGDPRAVNASSNARGLDKSGVRPTIDQSASNFSLNAGSSVSTIIENVVKVSEWFYKQAEEETNGPVRWIKIFPEVKFNQSYDEKTKEFGKDITYRILEHHIFDNKYGAGPRPKIPLSRIFKNYEYIYTGKNTEILDWTLEFNNTWNAFESVNTKAFKEVDGKKEDSLTGETQQGVVSPTTTTTTTEFQPRNKILVTQQADATATGDVKKDPTVIAAADLLKTILGVGKEMTRVTLRILGDPDFIKQDDVFFKAGDPIGNGIPMDGATFYVKLSFKTFADIDMETGLYTHNTPSFENVTGRNIAVDSAFSGYYSVVQIKSTFRGGKFEQELTLTRTFEQNVVTEL
jgi:hypothetical protein